MRIAIDISPLSSGHKVRGIGSYVSLIRENIEKYDKNNSYIFFEKETPKDVDLIHYPYSVPYITTLPLKFTKKTVVTVHDLTPVVFKRHFPAGIKGNLKWLLLERQLKKADLLITDSVCSKNDVVKILGVSEERVKPLYLAADSEFKVLGKGPWVNDIRKRYNLPETFLLYVGDATWNKNIPRLISAVKKTTYKLVMVGKVWSSNWRELSNNPWNESLIKVLKEIENDDQFLRLGFVMTEDLVGIYNMAKVFVMPSIYEGFGLPVLEAMNCGCPVICSNSGSLPEVGENAVFYIDPDKLEEIFESINRVVSDDELSHRLSKMGLEQAKKFTTKKMILDLVRIYESV